MSSSFLKIAIVKGSGNPPGVGLFQVVESVRSIVTGLKVDDAFYRIELATPAIQGARTYAELVAAINAGLAATLYGSDLQATLQADGFTILIGDRRGREFADEHSEVSDVGLSLNLLPNSSVGWGFEYVPPLFPPSHSLRALASTVDEGTSAVFVLTTLNTEPGTTFKYTLSGISAADITGGALTGSVVTGADFKATISIPIAADLLTEGFESLQLTVQGQSASVWIADTSTTPPAPTYSLLGDTGSVDEGSIATFTLSTTGVPTGSTVDYAISGISAADLTGGSLLGTAIVGANGKATIAIPVAADHLTEGSETMALTVQGKVATMLVNDVSRDYVQVPGVQVGSAVVYQATEQSERLVGRSGMDIAQYPLQVRDATWSRTGESDWQLAFPSLPNSPDVLSSIERIRFSDASVALDLDGVAGQAVRLLAVLLGPGAIADRQLAGIAIGMFDSGMNTADIARAGLAAAGITTSQQLTSTLWRNMTGLEAGNSEFELVQSLIAGGKSFAEIALLASDTAILKTSIGFPALQQLGVSYAPYVPALPPTPTYSIAAATSAVNEGAVAVFNITTAYVSPGTQLSYTLSGVSAADIGDGRLSGQVQVDANGKATLQIPIAADLMTEGAENLSVNISGSSATMRIDDTSLTPILPRYTVIPPAPSMNEGTTARFTVTTENVTPGTTLTYRIAGANITASDFSSGALSGQLVVDANGRGFIDIVIAADQMTEGPETLQLTVETSLPALLAINDTSLTGLPTDGGGG